MIILYIIYNIVICFVVVLLLIYGVIFNNKIIKSKLFFNIKPLFNNGKKTILIHGSSVGEILSCTALIKQLSTLYNIVISVNTLQGFIQSKNTFNTLNNVAIHYLPYDYYFLVKKFIKQTNPNLVLWLEQDFFINFFKHIKYKNIPLILLNARMSNTTYKRYLKVKFIAQYILQNFNLILSSSNLDNTKYSTLSTVKTEYLGNLKYTNLNNNYNIELFNSITSKLSSNNVVCLLSTHFNEEEVIIKELINTKIINNIAIIIVPRHIKRAALLKQQIEAKFNIKSTLVSKINNYSHINGILIADVMGEVNTMCKLSTVVYVGKSLLKNISGGHNLLEPMYMQSCVVVGSYMHNFLDITNNALKQNAIIKVNNVVELVEKFSYIINNISVQKSLQQNSYKFFEQNNILNNLINKITCYIK